jgi:hypothetical protein
MKKFVLYSLLGMGLLLFGASLQMGCNKQLSPIVPSLITPTPTNSTG